MIELLLQRLLNQSFLKKKHFTLIAPLAPFHLKKFHQKMLQQTVVNASQKLTGFFLLFKVKYVRILLVLVFPHKWQIS